MVSKLKTICQSSRLKEGVSVRHSLQLALKKFGRNPRSDRDLCKKWNKSPKKEIKVHKKKYKSKKRNKSPKK